MAKVTIITIVYNGMPYLQQCIESVFNQSFTDWELLISDDGSKDNSREYLSTLSDPRVTVYNQEKNLGIFDNINFLFERATAPLCQILCQDDYFIEKDSLQKLMAFWDNAPSEVGFVRFNMGIEDNKGLRKLERQSLPEYINPKDSILYYYVFGNVPGNLSNVSLRTNIFFEAGKFNQKLPYSGDYEFWIRVSKITTMAVKIERIVYIRTHKGAASSYLNKKGELIPQSTIINNKLYTDLLKQYPSKATLFKIHGMLTLDFFHRDMALKSLLFGNKFYYKSFMNDFPNKKFVLNNLLCWVIFFATLGGRVKLYYFPKQILNLKGK